MLAGQLPCFLLTESNMQHPQKKRQRGFCLPFLGRRFQGGPVRDGPGRSANSAGFISLFHFCCLSAGYQENSVRSDLNQLMIDEILVYK